jgi:polar amino acid transport system substrate-binding protein
VAYINYPPGGFKDANTGKLSGIAIESLEKLSQNLKLNIEYTEEVGWGTAIQGLDADRYDIIGSPVWANPVRGKLTTLSNPIYFTGIHVWVRQDENRLSSNNDWASLNSPDVRIGAIDGSTPEIIARTQFPNAKLVSYPDLTTEPQLFLDLIQNKIDVFFAEPAQALAFLKNNPNTIKSLSSDKPIRVFANVYMMKKNEPQLKQMIDTALQDLQNTGFIDQVIKKYEPGPGAFYRVIRPYDLGASGTVPTATRP